MSLLFDNDAELPTDPPLHPLAPDSNLKSLSAYPRAPLYSNENGRDFRGSVEKFADPTRPVPSFNNSGDTQVGVVVMGFWTF